MRTKPGLQGLGVAAALTPQGVAELSGIADSGPGAPGLQARLPDPQVTHPSHPTTLLCAATYLSIPAASVAGGLRSASRTERRPRARA